MVRATGFTPEQCALVRRARAIFLTSSVIGYPFYYLPPINGWFGGDGPNAKFPCSISWMTRKGLARYAGVSLWLFGWG